MDIYETIIRPIVTEKSTHQATTGNERRGGAYSFEVHPTARKPQIRDAVEKIYGVKVIRVRSMNRSGKLRRYRLRVGRTAATKKAVVVVDANSAIDLF